MKSLPQDYAVPPKPAAAIAANPPSKDSNKPRAAALAAATELGKLMLADGQQKEFELIAQSFGSMKEKLEHQISQATQLAAYFLKRGEKQMALEFHRLKKRAVADLATVNSFQANNRPLPPPFLHKEIQWTAPAEQRRDISISELQVAIMRLVSDGDLAATFGGKADFYIQWELAWPRDKTNKAYTRTIKFKELEENGYELDLDYKHNVDVVDRQHPRPLQRWVERGRLAIELYKYSGIIWGSQLIGKAALPLADLRTRSEVTALVEIKTGSDPLGRSAKPLPGGPLYVEVAARLRLPLSNSAEMAGHVEHWIYIDSQPSPQPSPQPMPSQQTTPQPSADAEKPEPVQEISPPPLADSAQSSQQAGASGPVAGGSFRKLATAQPSIAADNTAVVESSNADMAEIEAQMDSMDAVVSNAVLELELMQIPSRIGQTKDRDTASQLQDLEAAIKLRMSVVAAQVGAGALTIQEYMGNVTKELEAAKGWALAAKKGQRKDLALRALKRVKAMQNELKEMAEAMESAGDA
ncbi:hypothetical protein GGI12_000836 [Dipsacomyces acuminosporus]|nr:hypothetical protein GGI12_000836 [Dipsacomyces acuminosporus]